MEHEAVAVYIDFDNVVMSRYDHLHGPKSFRNDRAGARNPTPVARQRLAEARLDIGAIMDYAATLGPVAISRAYANWATPANADYGQDLVRSSIDLVQMFPVSGTKNGADIRLAIDVVDDLFRYPYLSHVVVVAGDSDYIALAQRCRRLDRRVVGIGVENSVGRHWETACDEFRFYDAVVTAAGAGLAAADTDADLEEVEPPLFETEGGDSLLVRTARLLHDKDTDAEWIAAAGLKSLMKRLDAAFDESAHGFRTFTDFLKANAALVDVQSTGSGTMLRLRERGESTAVAGPPCPPPVTDLLARRRKKALNTRCPVTPDLEALALQAVRFAWEICDHTSPSPFTALPTGPVRQHLQELGAEPDAAKIATQIALTFCPMLLRDDEMQLQPNPEVASAPDTELIRLIRGGMADRVRHDGAATHQEVVDVIYDPGAPAGVAAEYQELCARFTLQEMGEAIGAVLLPPQVLWDIAEAFASIPGDVALPSAEALERELHEHLRKLERDPDSVSFGAAHQALQASGLLLPPSEGAHRSLSDLEVSDVSAAIVRVWHRRCRDSTRAWHWEHFYQLALPDRFNVYWRHWTRSVVETA